jgi:AcrR family transcriptional regulator
LTLAKGISVTKRSVNETSGMNVSGEPSAFSHSRCESSVAGPESPVGGPESPVGVRRRIKAMRPGEILDAAFEEFVRNGYTATRLEDVARRVGLTKGALYLYFPSKVELFKAVVRGCVQPIFAEVEQILSTFEGSASDFLRALVDAAYKNVLENRRDREIVRLLMAEGAKHPELTEFYHSEVIVSCLRVLDRVIARGLETGEFRRSAVTDMPLVLMSPCVHASCWHLLFGDQHPLAIEKIKRAHLEVVLASLLQGPPGAATQNA